MKFAIISGSTRQNSQSCKVTNFIKYLIENQLQEEVYVLDLAIANLKYWDETFWQDSTKFDQNWTTASNEITNCDAVIIVAPEWNGMLPPALKNFFHLAVMGEIANKPGLIISISASVNGVYPVCELRLNSYKNTHICYIPQHLIIRNVNGVLNDIAVVENQEDKSIRERIDYTLLVLKEYAYAFQSMRKSAIIKHNKYPYGM